MTRIHQVWDLRGGELTLDITHARPLPAAAFFVIADLHQHLEDAARRLQAIADNGADEGAAVNEYPICGDTRTGTWEDQERTISCQRTPGHAGRCHWFDGTDQASWLADGHVQWICGHFFSELRRTQ